jgi:hypothetical protein
VQELAVIASCRRCAEVAGTWVTANLFTASSTPPEANLTQKLARRAVTLHVANLAPVAAKATGELTTNRKRSASGCLTMRVVAHGPAPPSALHLPVINGTVPIARILRVSTMRR